jgi:hypothetical protein
MYGCDSNYDLVTADDLEYGCDRDEFNMVTADDLDGHDDVTAQDLETAAYEEELDKAANLIRESYPDNLEGEDLDAYQWELDNAADEIRKSFAWTATRDEEEEN